MKLLELYQHLALNNPRGEEARLFQMLAHWYTVNAEFDPKTGEALPQNLTTFLHKVSRPLGDSFKFDRLWRIIEHARLSVERLFRMLNESPRREQALLHVRSVRELDASSFIKLNNRPGRNVREKLAGKPYLQAVRRFQSVNLPENRLFKAFVTNLAELLELRLEYLKEKEDELLTKIRSWLLSDEAMSIGRWENLPPNNTLLSHRDYRRVWDAWRWLQTLDDDISRDFSQLSERRETMIKWLSLGTKYSEGKRLFAEMPVFFNYEEFCIDPILPIVFQETTKKLTRTVVSAKIQIPACVDLTSIRPGYATEFAHGNLQETYLWQQWHSGDENVDIMLFNSDAAYLHSDTTTIFLTDLFLPGKHKIEHLDSASRAFAANLQKTFKNNTLIWLIPDFLNDFELEIIRRNLNARFPGAEPLPRSVAAVFEKIEHSTIKRQGYEVIVVDTFAGRTCVTKLISRFDQQLKERLPESNGFYWERCPPVIFAEEENDKTVELEKQGCDIVTLDSKGNWGNEKSANKPHPINDSSIADDPRIGPFNFRIDLNNAVTRGGIKLHSMQKRAGDIPLWCDQVPELSIKVFKDGLYKRFYLVSLGTKIKPVRGRVMSITVEDNFELRAGRPFYQFPLFQGQNEDEVGFSARLDSPAFPLKTDTICKLALTFEYGADEPYLLTFSPLNQSFFPVKATWKRNPEIIDAPPPGYPAAMCWADLKRFPKPGTDATSDLLDWFLSACDRLDDDLYNYPRTRSVGKICSFWHEDRHGGHFTYAKCNEAAKDVFIHERNFVRGFSYEDFDEGDELSFELEGQNGRYTGRGVADREFQEEAGLREFDTNLTGEIVRNIHRRLYVPFIQIWRDGRSIKDSDCTSNFSEDADCYIEEISGLLCEENVPEILKREFLFLLACTHKDTSDECIGWITEQVKNGKIDDHRAVGFALGDVSEDWQKQVFSRLASEPNLSAIRVFAYAIWREKHFIEFFSLSELKATLEALSQRLKKIIKGFEKKASLGDLARATAESLELLLGLLRARSSKDKEISMLLQPHQKITKAFAKQVECVTQILTKENVNLFSRVQLDVSQKPAGDRTPDLLYALRLYLTGDDGANAIHVTGISDNDNDNNS